MTAYDCPKLRRASCRVRAANDSTRREGHDWIIDANV